VVLQARPQGPAPGYDPSGAATSRVGFRAPHPDINSWEIFDFQADSNLRVQDTVSIAIEYGETQLMGNPAIDPSILQLVGIANGQAIFPQFIQ
jgi:hypothetical protein